MVVFECVACGAALTVPLRQVDRPDHEHYEWANSTEFTPSLLPPGTYAAQGDPLVGPGDVRGLSWVDEHPEGWCCGVDGLDPNLACACGQPVATRVDDCSRWQVVRFVPGAVRAAGEPEPVRAWEADDWDSAPLTDSELWWPRRVGIAAGVALARVLLAAGDARVVAAAGPVADLFRSHLDAHVANPLPSHLDARTPPNAPSRTLAPAGPSRHASSRTLAPAGPSRRAPSRTLALAGPGRPAQTDLLLVPRHPQTGEPWPAPGTVVPISAELWRWLANDAPAPLPRTGGQWEPYFRHDPLPARPKELWLDTGAARREMSKRRT
ncbi:hypothetical protein GCM10011609_22810 [Lentzea pudingi]|uniref:Uncharacterized protein n=1 Tax=Lentzea pudingi TaxID=1789439 RepID=A0ABQ2HP32_9PSEU|nr:hypothetical protein [Lentzea pudingi]GGM85946.1 hypothetical protein GCM10011609_22810 [Lentzea pudingi]